VTDASPAIPPLPQTGLPIEQILEGLRAYRTRDLPDKGGTTTAYVYDPGIDELDELGVRAYAIAQPVNGLDPTAFPSYAAVENDIVGAARLLFHGGVESVVGTMTSGGTESIGLAVLGARERWRATSGQPHGHPTMVLPSTAHPAFLKAAHLFDLEVVSVPVDRATYKADPAAMAAVVDERTALVVASAPSYAHGVIDPVEQVAAIAAEHDVPCHVDACIGWVAPFIRADEGLAPIDFSIPGVTSISTDLHKYGYTPKGCSVLLHRSDDLRRHHYFATTAWPGYPVVNPTLLSTRPGGPPAVAWAILHRIGLQGYRDLALAARRVTLAMAAGVDEIPGLRTVAPPESTLVAFADDGGPDDPDVRVVADEMSLRGWTLGAQPAHDGPATIHVSVSAVLESRLEQFLADMRDSARAARQLGRAEPDPALVAAGAAIDVDTLTADVMAGLLAIAGLDQPGGGLPARMAPVNALLDAVPPALVERLLIEVILRVYRPA
jgi:glutamate/tyrosine decarboxylase-like PLP-dependent enzyme